MELWKKTAIDRLSCALLIVLATSSSAKALGGRITYVYTDPQGTPLAEADTSGNVIASFDYKPYGSQALGTPPNGPGYTGHVNDPDTSLVYMQARYYDAAIGRFLSMDPVPPSPSKLFTTNRYSYAHDNPVTFIDPDGKEVRVTGSDEDKKLLKAELFQATGMQVDVKGGKLVAEGKRDSSVGSASAAKDLTKAIGMKQTITMSVVSNDAKTEVDAVRTGKVDVGDIKSLFQVNRDLGTGAIAHILSERISMAQGQGFEAAHNQALKDEATAFGHGAYMADHFSQPYPGGVFETSYSDRQGNEVSDFKLTFDNNMTPKP